MSKKLTAWLIAGVLGLVALGLWAGWTARLRQHNDRLSLELETERQRNFHELVGHMQTIQGLLGKGSAAGSMRQNMFYMGEVYRRTSLATANFMALPLPGPFSASMGKFLSQTGDFAFSIARSEAAGRHMDAKQKQELARLQQSAAQLASELRTVGQQASQQGFRWVGKGPRLADVFRRGTPAPSQAPLARNQAPKSVLPGGLEGIGPQMDQMPMMIYDGPFSDHLKDRKAAMAGAPISEEEARRRALSFLPDGNRYSVVETAKRTGTPTTFAVRMASTGDGKKYSLTVDVAQEGGYLVSFVNARKPGTPTLSLQQARDIGKAFLAQHGFPNMMPTYGEAVDGLATIQYAVQEKGVMIYPDQAKVRIALDTGEVLGVDARQYIMAHRDRGQLEVPAVSQAQAAKVVNPDLKVERVQLALIPTEAGDNEVLTYEFMGRLGDDTFLVYVNAKTGEEERIVQVLTTNNGTLAL